MSEQMNNECLVRCKHCGTVTTAEWNKGVLGLGKGWKLKDTKGSCPVCHQYINIDNLETALCPHCGKLVEKTEDGICINCHKSLAATVYRSQVECPQCGILVSVPEDPEFSCRCEICGTELTADYIRSRLAQKKVDTEQYILLPDTARMRAQDLVIWKHPQSSFPFKSRLQVNEGTYALFLQNGICRDPYDPGTYLLEKSDLTVSQKLDAAMDDDNVIFRTDVYCVLRDLNEFGWGAVTDISSASDENKKPVETDPFRNQEKTASWTASGNGRIALQVCDAKAFAQFAGFGEISLSGLTKVNPLGSEDGPLITLVRNQMSEALYACTNGMKKAELELLTATEIKDRLVQELDNRLAQNGLCVKALQIKDLAVKKTGKSEITDRIRDQVQSSFTWMVPAVRLHLPGEPNYYADVTFTGSGRVRIVNEAGFWSLSEVKKLIAASGAGPLSAGLNSSGSADADVLGRDKVTAALKTALPLTAQNQIDRGDIRDLTDPAQYVTALQDRLNGQLISQLAAYGLTLQEFAMDLPGKIDLSGDLAARLNAPARRNQIIHAAESAIRLTASGPVRVHTKQDPSIYVDEQFAGTCHLRIRDEAAFFGLSEISRFMTDKQAVSEASVTEQLRGRLVPLFTEVVSRVAQSIVEQTNADIRELNRFTGILKNSVLAGISERVEPWGLVLETLDLDVPVTVASSNNLEKQSAYEEIKTGVKLEEEIRKVENDHTIFGMDEEKRVEMHRLDTQDQLDDRKNEQELAKLERANALKAAELQKGADLEKLVDEIAEAKRSRADAAILEDYKRKYRQREEKIQEQLQEAQMLQEAQIASKQRETRAAFARQLEEAENQRALNDLMHKIDESNLTWRQKLDEYERLRARTQVEDRAAEKKLDADTDLQILRDRNELYYQIGSQRIRLDAEQAELLEKINRYTEDRKERTLEAEAARLERKATLDFEHRLQDRREQVAQQIELLKARYDHELSMRQKDLELEKLQEEMAYKKTEVQAGADVMKTQAGADSAARIAEAQAALKRAEDQLAREESIAKQAEEFKKTLLEIQAALEMTRLGNDKNKDNRWADVEIARANAGAAAAKATAERTSGAAGQAAQERFLELERKMDRIINSVRDLRTQVNTLKKWLPPYTAVPPYGYRGGLYGGIGGNATPPVSPATKICPLCGKNVPATTTICPFCQNPIV